MKRIGIYSGTFNPVHSGHISFALQTLEIAGLDEIYFLPERRHRTKQGVEHFGHRVAMLRQALKPHTKFDLLEFDDTSFSIQRTLPKLLTMFADAQLVFLVGSDVVMSMQHWPHVDRLFAATELVVGMRQTQSVTEVKDIIASWSQPPVVTLINSYAPDVSSSAVREALQARQEAKGVLKSVAKYSDHHWLYVAFK